MEVFHMKLSKSLAAFAVLAMAVVNNVHADQIDNEAHELAQAPAAVLVKVDQDAKKVHVYRVNSLDARVKARSMDEATMNAYASTIAVDANKVGEMDIVTSTSELDNEASTQAWWGRWWGYGWGGYGWGWGGYGFGYGGYGYGFGYGWGWGRGCWGGWYW
jgi:hypothetical protein